MGFGVTLSITTDNGSEFTAKVDNLLFCQLRTKRILTSLYNPRSNGEIEQTLKIHMYIFPSRVQLQHQCDTYCIIPHLVHK